MTKINHITCNFLLHLFIYGPYVSLLESELHDLKEHLAQCSVQGNKKS